MKISGLQYTMMYGPTVGDKIRLADTNLAAAKLSVMAWANPLTT